MKIEYTDVQNLLPTQPTVKLRNLVARFSQFNPEFFDPISVSFDKGKYMIINGHHRSAILLIALRDSDLGSKFPIAPKRKLRSSLPVFSYESRKADSLEQLHLEISSEHTVPLSKIYTSSGDVYASINGSSRYLFTLPEIDLLKQAKTRHLMVA